MRRPGCLSGLCALVLLFSAGWSDRAEAQSVEPLALDGQISEDGTRLGVSWQLLGDMQVRVFRRPMGRSGLESWEALTPKVLSPVRFLDDTLEPGQAYEYQVRQEGQGVTRVGYWAAGRNVPDMSAAGKALVIVDDTLAEALEPYLTRFELDLIGDGWEVERHLAPRPPRRAVEETMRLAQSLRVKISNRYWSDPFTRHAVILVGHVPVVYTGLVGPDGHKRKAVPSDLFYADPEGSWQAIRDAKGKAQFVPSVLPADHIKMQVGRIDFAGLGEEFGGELSLLKAYFDKNHHWRHARLGDPRQAYGQNKNLLVEQYALRNIVGPGSVKAGGHHDTTGQGPFLLGIDFGSWKGKEYANLPPSEAVFTINFGSGKQMFAGRDNPMTALLAQPWYPLTVGWGGRPSWQLHGLAMGESIGQAHMRTVNNGTYSKGGMKTREYVPTGNYDWINPPWVNLLGDPTLKPFPVKPVTNFEAQMTSEGMRLTWTVFDGAEGVILYRADKRGGPYQALAGGNVLTEALHIDRDGTSDAWYMVRAKGLVEVYAGSFYRLSQGTFATAGNAPPSADTARMTLSENAPVALEWPISDPDKTDYLLVSPIRGPSKALRREGGGIVFDPGHAPHGLSNISFSVFDGVTSRTGVLEVDTSALPR